MSALMNVVFYSVNNPVYTQIALKYCRENSDPRLTRIYSVDNGSSPPYEKWDADELIRYDRNIGGNAVFHRLLQEGRISKDVPYTAFLHCDLILREPGWDKRVLDTFAAIPSIGLIGFVGSDVIDWDDSRALGTVLNYLGDYYEGYGQSSPAEVHGARVTGLVPAAVLDHCSMIFDTELLMKLTPQEGHLSPEHYYDRWLSCEVMHHGRKVAVLGISCDHFNGGTRGGEVEAHELRKQWLEAEGLPYDEQNSGVATFVESKRRFLTRWRDEEALLPVKVDENFRLHHQHIRRGGTLGDLRILILLAYYNRPNMVRNALISVIRAGARHPDWQLAFIDDGSLLPGRPVVEELLGDQLHKVRFYQTGDDMDAKVRVGGSRHGLFLNKAIQDSDADICLMLCDDDALHGDYLYNLNQWFKQNPKEKHCYSHVWIYNPYESDPWSVPFTENSLNRFTEPIHCSCNVDASQVAWRRDVNVAHDVWFEVAQTGSLDSKFFEKLNGKTGPTPFSGFISQYKGEHPLQLGSRGVTAEDFWAKDIDIPAKEAP